MMTKTNSKEKKVLVLGASGQIGKEVLSQLNTKKCSITAVRRSQWEEPFLDNEISYQNLDLKRANLNDLENLILDQDVIFHLAGDTSVQVEKKLEMEYFFSWIKPLKSLLNLMVGTEKKLIFASSASVYGVHPKLPVVEESVEEPFTSYDLAKVSCDQLIKYYKKVLNVNCSSLRFSNVYGPMPIVKNSSRRAINQILENIHKNKEVSVISDGNFLRNYIHAYDAAAMLIHTSQKIEDSPPIVLACSKQNMPFREVISKLIKCYKSRFDTEIKVNFGLKPVFITDERQFSAEPSLIFSQDFNFRYSLEKGFEEMVEELL